MEENKEFSNSRESECDCNPKILIVDDNTFNLQPLKYFINNFSVKVECINSIKRQPMYQKNIQFEVEEANNGEEAV